MVKIVKIGREKQKTDTKPRNRKPKRRRAAKGGKRNERSDTNDCDGLVRPRAFAHRSIASICLWL